jgi:hypothetical protein
MVTFVILSKWYPLCQHDAPLGRRCPAAFIPETPEDAFPPEDKAILAEMFPRSHESSPPSFDIVQGKDLAASLQPRYDC